jgi:hypothetical protein
VSKQIDKIKVQLLELADAINAFKSDAVQLQVIDRVLKQLNYWNRSDNESEPAVLTVPSELTIYRNEKTKSFEKTTLQAKQPGATKILNLLVNTDYFDIPRSISDITDYCNKNHTGIFYTYQVSGIVLGLMKKNKLIRYTSNETNRYVYTKPMVS